MENSPANEQEKIYLMMNKPAGYVCSACSDSHHTVYELLPAELQALVTQPKRGHRLHTVGRLDCDTCGLLLFTNDGNFSHQLTSPEFHIEKTYIARLKNPGHADYSQKALQGLILPAEKKAPEQKSEPAKLRPLDKDFTLWEVKISEGKFHQVRRIFQALGNQVVELKRVKLGQWELGDLEEGKIKRLRISVAP